MPVTDSCHGIAGYWEMTVALLAITATIVLVLAW
jgi:hypothetical protein